MFFLIPSLSAPPSASAFKIEPELMSKIASEGPQGYLIYFHEKADLPKASTMAWAERGEFVVNTLQTTAETTQSRVRKYLDQRSVRYQSFWIANVIVVEGSDKITLEGLVDFSEIESVKARRFVPAPDPDSSDLGGPSVQAIETNLTYIKADKAWELGYDGAGITVGIIDSGVRYTHKALAGKYRGNLGNSFDHNYNWWDPGKRCGGAPCDLSSHGTHVTGIIVGDDGSGNQIGVAPGAKWIACQACDPDGCPDDYLFSCGQFMLAPTDSKGNNPDPARRPQVINNSWNSPSSGDKFYWSIVANWQAAGIHPVFANGNAGPGCNTAGSPGDYPMVTSAGNMDHTTGLPADKSSRGPSIFENQINPMGYPYLKPLISAPGMNIRSSYYTGDDNYIAKSGTSMAAPHTAGLLALILQAAPCLTYAQVEKILAETATPISYISGCGTEGPGGVPNNATGWGAINAFAAVQKILGICGGMGALQGTVTSKSKTPVEGALVTTGSRLTAVTDGEGRYVIPRLSSGSQTITVEASGYYRKTETIAISGNVTATAHVVMEPKPKVTVKGKIIDGSGGGWPLYATISASSQRSDSTVSTDPATGRYSLTLYADTTYTFTVSSRGYAVQQMTMTPANRSVTQDFSLTVDRTCSAPGYEDIRLFYEEFEGSFPPSGWTTLPYSSGSDVWHRNDYFKTPNKTNGSGYCAQVGVEDVGKWDAGLITPPLDLPADGTATLFYENLFWSKNPPFETWLEVTTDGGNVWHTLTDWTNSRGPILEQVDLSGYAGKTIQIRWRYSTKNQFNYLHQQIDNVKVTTGCRLKSDLGGLVVGRMYDGNTGKPVTEEVTVSNDISETASTDSSGLFILYSSGGSRTFTAKPSAGSSYLAAAQNVVVRPGKTVKKDFHLPAGRLASAPERLTITVAAGSTKTKTLRLINKGGKNTTFWLTTAIPETAGPHSLSPQHTIPRSEGRFPLGADAPATGAAAWRGGEQIGTSPEVHGVRSVAEGSHPATGAPSFAVNLFTNDLVASQDGTPDGWIVQGRVPRGMVGSAFVDKDPTKLYALNGEANSLYTIDTKTGEAIRIGKTVPRIGEAWTAMTATGDGALYGASTSLSRSTLYSINRSTGRALPIGEITNGRCVAAIAVNSSRQIYGLDLCTDVFLWIDSATATGVVIGSLGFDANYAQSMAFENRSGTLYLAAYNNATQRGEFRIVDTASGNTRVVGSFPDGAQTGCLAVAADPEAPWLEVSPKSGAISAKGRIPITVTFDSKGLSEGTYKAEIRAVNTTPYGAFTIPVTMEVVTGSQRASTGAVLRKGNR